MSLRTVMRSSVGKPLRWNRCIRQCYVTATPMMSARPRPFDQRGYATEPKNPKFNLPDEYAEEVFQSLANNPPVMQALHNVVESLDRKGIKLDREPNVSEMWTIMKDKDVMESLNNLSKVTKASGIKLDHILKNLPWSKANENFAQGVADPTMSSEAIQKRMKAMQEILRRPDPGAKPKTVDAKPIFEEDKTDKYMNEEDHLSLGEVQADLRGWWKAGEEAAFYKRLAEFRARKGDEILDGDVYDFWIEEWTRKVKEVSKIR